MGKEIIDMLTVEEKARLLVGHKTMSTYPIPEKGVEPIFMSDGPNGLRMENPEGDSLTGVSDSMPTTCFPTGVTLASSWNEDLALEMGKAMGEECVNFGVDLLLGPAVNIQRNPLCGRNFEYLSEDPLLSGKLGASLVKGIQGEGVGACVKHFACNNNEKYRFTGDSIVDERALHEIYLKPFQTIVEESKPKAIMAAYNQVNGHFCSENRVLLDDILRKKWGFGGVILTDWGGIVHRDLALKAGCDLEMPGMVEHNILLLKEAMEDGRIDQSVVDASVKRLLDLKKKCRVEKKPCDFNAHYRTALNIALEGATLLKNDKAVLPLNKTERHLVVGGLFSTMRYQGSGSSLLNPILLKTHKEAFDEMGVDYEFSLGYREAEEKVDSNLEQEALEKAKAYDKVVFFGGLNDYFESEGFDRDDMRLPENQVSLIEKLLDLGKKVILVLFGGSPVELPFENRLDAILDMMLPGEAGGEATTKLLFGEACPSGKLTQSWPLRYEDVPFGDEFAKTPNELYKESIFVGYRYYSSAEKAVRYPFGYGLSYTHFTYDSLTVGEGAREITLTVKVTNVGSVPGKETVEVYLSKKDSGIIRPALELKGFKKVPLLPGESKTVTIIVPKKYLGVYVNGKFRMEKGSYTFLLGPSSASLPLSASVDLEGESLEDAGYGRKYRSFIEGGKLGQSDFEDIIGRKITPYEFAKRPYTMETPIGEFNTFFGKIFKKAVCGVGERQFRKAAKIKDPLKRERERKAGHFVSKLMPNNSLRSLAFSSSGAFPYPIALGILEMANGHFIRGIGKMIAKNKRVK